MIVVLMGPMGCGKTTVGKLLSGEMGWDFFDGDDFHPSENKKKMAEGIPLDDNDREPWLKILNQLIRDHMKAGRSMVLACSALKETYRQQLGIDQKMVVSVFLRGSPAVLKEHLAGRSHEYMSNDLLNSQLKTLEEPDAGIIVDVSGTPEQTTRETVRKLREFEEEQKTDTSGTGLQ